MARKSLRQVLQQQQQDAITIEEQKRQISNLQTQYMANKSDLHERNTLLEQNNQKLSAYVRDMQKQLDDVKQMAEKGRTADLAVSTVRRTVEAMAAYIAAFTAPRQG